MSARQGEALVALQTALTSLFKADTTLTQMVGGRIHDGAARPAVTPYLVFSDAAGRDWSTADGVASRIDLDIDVIGDDEQRARSVKALDRAVQLATGTGLLLSTGYLVMIRQNGMDVRRLADGRQWRARASLTAWIE